MTIFEYVMVLVSIIIGLGIARMLDGILRILRSGRPYRTYWVHSLWLALTFFEMVGHWAYRWTYQARADWTLFELLFFLLPTILLFLASGLLFPEAEVTPMREYYHRQRQVFFTVFISLMVVYSMENWWVLDTGFGSRGDIIRSLIVALCIPLTITRRTRIHAVLAVAVFVVIIGGRFPILRRRWDNRP